MFPIDYVLLVEREQIVWQIWRVWQSQIDFVFIATEDMVEALEGGAQSEASRSMKGD